MNLIEAWKAAKVGDHIRRSSDTKGECDKIKRIGILLSSEWCGMYNEWLLADDWEVVDEGTKVFPRFCKDCRFIRKIRSAAPYKPHPLSICTSPKIKPLNYVTGGPASRECKEINHDGNCSYWVPAD